MAPFVQSGPFSRKAAESVERLPSRVLNFLGRVGQYLGSEKATLDYTRLLQGASANAQPLPSRLRPPTQEEIAARINAVRAFDTLPADLAPGIGPAPSPILTPADSFKPAPFTQEGQFGRYFKTPEFDYVFGGGARGKGAPATAAAMEQLAAQEKAPMDSPLSSYYAAQSAMGRVNQPQIQEMYKDRPDLQKWAAANPMLAQREYAKKYGTTDITNLAPDQETVMGDLGSRAQAEGGYTLEGFGIRDKVDKFLGKK